jgi:hypothetical protein
MARQQVVERFGDSGYELRSRYTGATPFSARASH